MSAAQIIRKSVHLPYYSQMKYTDSKELRLFRLTARTNSTSMKALESVPFRTFQLGFWLADSLAALFILIRTNSDSLAFTITFR